MSSDLMDVLLVQEMAMFFAQKQVMIGMKSSRPEFCMTFCRPSTFLCSDTHPCGAVRLQQGTQVRIAP